MPLYELMCIGRLNRGAGAVEAAKGIQQFIVPLVRSSALHVLDNGGVVRQFQKISCEDLPYRMKRHQEIFTKGCVWSMLFDASPKTVASLKSTLNFDDRVIRSTIVKLGSSMKHITRRVHPDKL